MTQARFFVRSKPSVLRPRLQTAADEGARLHVRTITFSQVDSRTRASLNGSRAHCPKFDDVEAYVQKFSEIFKTADIKSITVVVMEMPCCQGLPFIVQKGLELAGKKIPFEKVIISARVEILKREKLAA